MWQAALVLVGVVVGGAIAGGMALRQEQRMVVHLHGEAVNIEERRAIGRRQGVSVSFRPASMSSLHASRACTPVSSMTHFVASSPKWHRLPWEPSTLPTERVRRA